MKQLACLLCGGFLVPRQDGVYVCCNCGKPYPAEEISRMAAGTPHLQNANPQFVPQYAPNAWNPNVQPAYQGVQAAQPKKSKKGLLIGLIAGVVALLVAAVLIALLVIVPNSNYNEAKKLLRNGKYDQAIEAFENLDGYKDSDEMILKCHYEKAMELFEDGDYEKARKEFKKADGYDDSDEMIERCKGDVLEGTWKTEDDEVDGTWTWTFDGAGKCTLSCEETGINMEGTYQLDEEAKTVTAKMELWDSEKVYAYTLTDTTLDLEETYSSYHLTKQ